MPADSKSDVAAGRPRHCDREAREDHLLNTAAALFIKNGYSGTSLDLIAREARVAVRTIYIKFGGKAGLLSALITRRRTRYTAHLGDLASDTRPLLMVMTDYGMRFLALVSAPESIALQRMVIIESHCNPELGHTAYRSGIVQTYALLSRFFERPDIRAQLRDNVDLRQVPALLISCVIGDPLHHVLFGSEQLTRSACEMALAGRLELFLRGVLR